MAFAETGLKLIPGVTRYKPNGAILQGIFTHVGKDGETYVDALSFANDLNDLNELGFPKCFLYPLMDLSFLKNIETPEPDEP